MEDYLKEIESLIESIENSEVTKNWEITEKIRIYKSSLEILKKYNNHRLIKCEIMYQNYRTSFSQFYFSGSDWYRGDSLIAWRENRPLKEQYRELMGQVAVMILIKNMLGIE
jgi:hypothetical protein